jgi:hypothetical protein
LYSNCILHKFKKEKGTTGRYKEAMRDFNAWHRNQVLLLRLGKFSAHLSSTHTIVAENFSWRYISGFPL